MPKEHVSSPFWFERISFLSEQHLRESTIQFMSGGKGMAAKCYETLGEETNGDIEVFT